LIVVTAACGVELHYSTHANVACRIKRRLVSDLL
jgi:hypothetical protein